MRKRRKNQTLVQKFLYLANNKLAVFSLWIYFFIPFFLPFGGGNYLFNNIYLIPIFYFTNFTKKHLSFVPIILLGVVKDGLNVSFFGLNLFLIIAFYSFFVFQKYIKISKNLVNSFFFFAITILALFVIKVLLVFYLKGGVVFSNLIAEYILLLLLYIPSYFIFENLKTYMDR